MDFGNYKSIQILYLPLMRKKLNSFSRVCNSRKIHKEKKQIALSKMHFSPEEFGYKGFGSSINTEYINDKALNEIDKSPVPENVYIFCYFIAAVFIQL